jgi:WD40 repeat protein
MLRNKVLIYDGSRVSSQIVEAEGALRWAAWRPDGSEALIVGNNGTILAFSGDRKSVRNVSSPVKANLRGVDFSPDGRLAVIVGNAGTILLLSDLLTRLESATSSNLRRVSWKPDGTGALIVGNEGAAYFLASIGLKRVYGVGNNLRSAAWHPKEDYCVVVGNSVKATLAGLVPAPGFYRFDTDSFFLTQIRQTSPETPKDLSCASWKPDGSQCIIVGYDQTWRTSELYFFDGKSVTASDWKEENVLPTGFAWHPSGRYGLIVTGALDRGETGMVLGYDGPRPSVIHQEPDYSISCVTWNPRGDYALMLGSRGARSYSA